MTGDEDQLTAIARDVAVIRTHMEYIRESVMADGKRIRALDRRVGVLEAWRWRLVGAAAAIGAGAGAFGGPVWDKVIGS